MEQKTILITGFGPFSGHTVNASWAAVQKCVELYQYLETTYNVKLIHVEVPVAYKVVSELVPNLWKEHKPMFVIHVGVSGKAKFLTLEARAHSSGYVRPDIFGNLPDEQELQTMVFYTDVDIKELSNYINNNYQESHCKAIISQDAGRFLCEYIFYKSLSIDSSRALFIHVPDLNVYPIEQTAKGLCYIIHRLLKQFHS